MSTAVTPNLNAQQILEVAIRLFAQKGFEATSTREIVEAAGVTKPMLYYYYESKEGLCRAAVQYFFDLFICQLNKVVAVPRDPKDTLVELAWTYFSLCQKHRDISRFFMSLYFGPLRERIAIDYRAFSQRENEVLGAAADKAEQSGLIRSGCREEFMLSFDSLVSTLNMRALGEGFELTHGHAERIVENLLNGFGRHDVGQAF